YPCARGHAKRPAFVDRYPKGFFGLRNMAGNVAEWVADCYRPRFYQRARKQDPKATSCGEDAAHVIRGGSFSSPPQDLRNAARKAAWARGAFFDVGFRCARAVLAFSH
ncbi:MAG: SUMF1/EgtB/PvdO family nonheme iron enzyme, partial [Myxococcota bacterium]